MNEKDDFWNIDRILPKRKYAPKTANDVECVKVTTNTHSPSTPSGVDIRMLISAVNEKRGMNSLEDAIVKEAQYTHFENSNVMSSAYVGRYNNSMVYENKIRAHALSLFNKTGQDSVPFVEYFSFTPAYYELSSEQLMFYLSWRKKAREGIFLKTSPSYVLLYVSEIVNLPDKIHPQDALITLIALWDECLSQYGKYDKIMADIIFDYAIVHNLKLPFQLLEPVLFKASHNVSSMLFSLFVYDYLLVYKKDLSEEDLKFLFEKELGFSFKVGKHYKNNTSFQNLLDDKFYSVLQSFFKNSPSYIPEIFSKHKKRSAPIKVVRPAFLAINTSVEIKKNLLYEHYVFDKSDIELDHLINVAKHIENKFRAVCSIRARLSVSPLSESSKRLLDKVISEALSTASGVFGIANKAPAIKKVEVDVTRAKNIEEASWETTKKLTDGIEIFYDEEDQNEQAEKTEEEKTGFELLFIKLDLTEKNILMLLLNNQRDEAEKFCREKGAFLDSITSQINETSIDCISDIIIDASTKEIFSEYSEEITHLLSEEKE